MQKAYVHNGIFLVFVPVHFLVDPLEYTFQTSVFFQISKKFAKCSKTSFPPKLVAFKPLNFRFHLRNETKESYAASYQIVRQLSDQSPRSLELPRYHLFVSVWSRWFTMGNQSLHTTFSIMAFTTCVVGATILCPKWHAVV